MSDKKETANRYGKAVKAMQILSFIFMMAMLTVCILFMRKNNISVSNVDALTQYLTGGVVTIALIITIFSIVKSFALIFPPAVLFVLSGIVFDKLWITMKEKGISTYKLREECGIDSKTIRRLKANENIETKTIDKLCSVLNCKIEDIVEYLPEK